MLDDNTLMARALRWVCDDQSLTVDAVKLLDGYRQSALRDYALSIAEDMRYNALKYFRPFDYQLEFYKTGVTSDRRGILAANRVGKTVATCFELAIHLTGEYPHWWEGKRFTKPITCFAAGESWQQVALVLQQELMGTPDAKLAHMIGTGAIPRNNIVFETIRSDSANMMGVEIRHKSGGISRLIFGNYTQEVRNMQGFKLDLVVFDEQPPDDMFSELVTRTATLQGQVLCSFTPLKGLNGLVSKFWNQEPGYQFIRVAWSNVDEYDGWGLPFLLQSTRDQLERDFMPWEREARIAGIPVLGQGAVFQLRSWPTYKTNEWDLKSIQGMERIIALDLGLINDKTVISFMFWNPLERIAYLHQQITVSGLEEANPVNYIQYLMRPEVFGCPIVLPADASTQGRYTMSSSSIRELFEEYGLNVWHRAIMNPKNSEGKVTNHKAFGINVMRQMMEAGTFLINENCTHFLREAQNYFVDDKGRYSDPDDCIDSARYALLGCLNEICEPVHNSVRSRKLDHYRDMMNSKTSNHLKPEWKRTYDPGTGA
jgi:phage terminase large subunit-like protein